jgi:hypothetical protein
VTLQVNAVKDNHLHVEGHLKQPEFAFREVRAVLGVKLAVESEADRVAKELSHLREIGPVRDDNVLLPIPELLHQNVVLRLRLVK